MNKRDIWDETDSDAKTDTNRHTTKPETTAVLNKKLLNVIKNNQHELVQSLIDEGADIENVVNNGETPLITPA